MANGMETHYPSTQTKKANYKLFPAVGEKDCSSSRLDRKDLVTNRYIMEELILPQR